MNYQDVSSTFNTCHLDITYHQVSATHTAFQKQRSCEEMKPGLGRAASSHTHLQGVQPATKLLISHQMKFYEILVDSSWLGNSFQKTLKAQGGISILLFDYKGGASGSSKLHHAPHYWDFRYFPSSFAPLQPSAGSSSRNNWHRFFSKSGWKSSYIAPGIGSCEGLSNVGGLCSLCNVQNTSTYWFPWTELPFSNSCADPCRRHNGNVLFNSEQTTWYDILLRVHWHVLRGSSATLPPKWKLQQKTFVHVLPMCTYGPPWCKRNHVLLHEVSICAATYKQHPDTSPTSIEQTRQKNGKNTISFYHFPSSSKMCHVFIK